MVPQIEEKLSLTVNSQFRFLVGLIQQNGFRQFSLRAYGTRVPFLIDPFSDPLPTLMPLPNMYIVMVRQIEKKLSLTVNSQLRFLVGLIQSNGFRQFSLRAYGTRVPFLINPFNGERMDPWKTTDFSHFTHNCVIGDCRINVRDKHLPEIEKVTFS